MAGRSTDHPFPLVLFGQKIRTIEMDGKTIKLQIVSSPFSHVTFMKKKKFVQCNILLVHNVWIPDYLQILLFLTLASVLFSNVLRKAVTVMPDLVRY